MSLNICTEPLKFSELAQFKVKFRLKLFKDFRIVDFDKNMNLVLSKLLWKYENNLLPKCIDDILNNNHSSFLPQRVKAIGYNFVTKFRTCIKQRFVSNWAPPIWSQSVKSKKL